MRMKRRIVFALASVVMAGCGPSPQIACTTGTLKACFGTEVFFYPFGNDSTRIEIWVQDLQGTVTADNTAWSSLLYIRVYRNLLPQLNFPVAGGSVLPTWSGPVQTLGPSAPGSGWKDTGVSYPSFVSEWIATGGGYSTDVGYVSGRDTTYHQVVNTGSGLRTYNAAGHAPGWVKFSFIAHSHVTKNDIGIELSAWASAQPASTLAVPSQVGCTILVSPVSQGLPCTFLTYDLLP